MRSRSIAPLDEEAIRQAARETRAVVTVEEATVTGGLGAAVAAIVVSDPRPVPMRMLGIPRQFAPTGDTGMLFDHFGLTAAQARSWGSRAARATASSTPSRLATRRRIRT